MAGFRLKYAALTGQFAKTVQEINNEIADAATGAIRDAGEFIITAGRANIAAAGFSRRWQNTLRVNLYPNKGRTLHPALVAFHKIPYAGIFEQGGTIQGNPMLWLPLPDVPSNLKGRHMSPANYVRLIGPLKPLYRPGKPPLLLGQMLAGGRQGITVAKLVAGNRKTGLPGGPAKVVWVPLFYGLDTVKIGKKFNLQPIFDKAANNLGEYYVKNLKV